MSAFEVLREHDLDFSTPRKKPVGRAKLRKSNPLVTELSRSYLINESGGDILHDLAGGADFTLSSGTATREARKDGSVFVNDGASFFTTATEVLTFMPTTYAVEYVPDQNTESTTAIFSVGETSADGDPWVLIALNGTTLRAFTAGAYFGLTTNWSIGERLHLVVRNLENLWTFFLNGVSLGTKVNFSNPAGVDEMYLGAGFTNQASGDYISCNVWDHRGLTDGEILSLYKDPYQLYESANPQIYHFPVEAAPAGGRIMGAIAGAGGLAGRGGIAGPGGGIAG